MRERNSCILTTIMISITTVHIQMQIQGNTKLRRLRCSGTNAFINFWLHFFDARRETILKSLSTDTILITPQRSAHLVVQYQFLNTMVGPQLLNIIVHPNFSTLWSDSSFSPSSSELNWIFFQNLPNSQPISSGHDVIYTPATYPVWGLLWQCWLSYPLRASVNCTNWLHTWTCGDLGIVGI